MSPSQTHAHPHKGCACIWAAFMCSSSGVGCCPHIQCIPSTIMTSQCACGADDGGGDTRESAAAVGPAAGPQLRDQAAVGRRCCFQKPDAWRAKGAEAIHQRHHTQRLPPEVLDPLHQVMSVFEEPASTISLCADWRHQWQWQWTPVFGLQLQALQGCVCSYGLLSAVSAYAHSRCPFACDVLAAPAAFTDMGVAALNECSTAL